MCIVAKEVGSLLLSSWTSSFVYLYPTMPAFLQTMNAFLWVINVTFNLVENIWIISIWMVFIGGLYGSAYCNAMFTANAKTDLEADLNLDVKERELVVNLFLTSNYMGKFYGLFLTIAYVNIFLPRIIFFAPD